MSIFSRPQVDDDTLVRAAKAALTHPSDAAFWGEDDLFVTWGLGPIGRHRDSDNTDNSNYERLLEDLRKQFPADVDEIHAGHWAVGWYDHLSVRVLEPWAPEDWTVRDVTTAFAVVIEQVTYLREQYPVYDEADLSQRDFEEREAARADQWGDVVHALWYEFDVEKEDVTEADEAVFEEFWEGTEDNWVNRDTVAEAIMAARKAVARAKAKAEHEAANTPLF